MWSPQEAKTLKEIYGTVLAKEGMEAAVLAVATRAGELLAERVLPDDALKRAWEADTYSDVKAFVATLQAKVEELEGELTGLRAAFDDEQGIARRALNERDALRAEVERLKAEATEADLRWHALDQERLRWKGAHAQAESRIAAILERAKNTEEIRKQFAEARASHCTPEAAALSVAMWVWEKDGLHMPVTAPRETQPAGQVANWVASLEEFLGDGTDRGLSAGNTREALQGLAGLAGEAENLRASVAALESDNNTYEKAVDTLTRRVEKLNAKVADMEGAYSELESDASQVHEALDSIRARAADEDGIRRAIRADFDRSRRAGDGRQTYQSAGLAVARWVLEGGAPQEATVEVTEYDIGDGPFTVTRYPCSSTCTHDDAATPGHPERVKAQSIAVARAALGMPDSSEVMDEVVDMASVDQVAALAKKAGAKNGREVASYRCGYEQACDDMRAACLTEVLDACATFGLGPAVRDAVRKAIEGAAP